MHVATGYPLYLSEARSRWYYYPAPYYYNGSWAYATPWLWYDGNKHGSYTYSQWQSKITTEMNVPAPVTSTMIGAYNPSTRHLVMSVKYRNDTTVTLSNTRSMMVITEDSIYQTGGSNGDYWHNHVARKYLPTYTGQVVNIPAGDSVTVTQQYTLPAGWNAARCQVVAWLQSNVISSDTILPVYQGGLVNVTALPIEEIISEPQPTASVQVIPNPCVHSAEFVLPTRAGDSYSIVIHDVAGREINRLSGIAVVDGSHVTWNRDDRFGRSVPSGVYLFRFENGVSNLGGTVIVR